MYIPKTFNITDEQEILSFIKRHAFGQLISSVEGRPFSTHIPFLIDESSNTLIAHLAKPNPQWQNIEEQEILVSFQGPHAYISPQWYEAPGVPTWNYQAVHVYGRGAAFHDKDRLKKVVDTLADKYESDFEKPWQPDYKAAMLHGIVGLEIKITEIQCKYKLSQNRSNEDRQRVIDQLQLLEEEQLSQAMENAENKV